MTYILQRSMIHYDADNILHCVVAGRKDWMLINPKDASKLDMVIGQRSSVTVDVVSHLWDFMQLMLYILNTFCLFSVSVIPCAFCFAVKSHLSLSVRGSRCFYGISTVCDTFAHLATFFPVTQGSGTCGPHDRLI